MNARVWYFSTDHVFKDEHEMRRDKMLNLFDYETLIIGEGKIREIYSMKGMVVFKEKVNKNWLIRVLETRDVLADEGSSYTEQDLDDLAEEFQKKLPTLMDDVFTIRVSHTSPGVINEGMKGLEMYDEEECLNCGA
jgi:hypothetical protein